MTDPYSILGINSNATDDEVKRAYRELARKYHPDNYQNNPLADLAEEKMKEINEAYEAITKQRSGGGYAYQQSTYQQRGNAGGSGAGQGQGSYAQVRAYINAGRIDDAERLLQSIPQSNNGEWYFLAGSIAYRRGWLDEAAQNYNIAVQLNPNNPEYRQAANMMRQGGASYRPHQYSSGMDAMDCCSTLLCLNCLCGGNGC